MGVDTTLRSPRLPLEPRLSRQKKAESSVTAPEATSCAPSGRGSPGLRKMKSASGETRRRWLCEKHRSVAHPVLIEDHAAERSTQPPLRVGLSQGDAWPMAHVIEKTFQRHKPLAKAGADAETEAGLIRTAQDPCVGSVSRREPIELPLRDRARYRPVAGSTPRARCFLRSERPREIRIAVPHRFAARACRSWNPG